MNCGMPTLSAASRPRASSTVALRSFDWFRIGVVAVRLTYVAISKQTVSMRATDHLGGHGVDLGIGDRAPPRLGQLDQIDCHDVPL